MIFFLAIGNLQKLTKLALDLQSDLEFENRQWAKRVAVDVERDLPQFARQNVYMSSGCAKLQSLDEGLRNPAVMSRRIRLQEASLFKKPITPFSTQCDYAIKPNA